MSAVETTLDLSVAAVLDRAASVVAEGWTRRWYKHDDCYCVIGAISRAIGQRGAQAEFDPAGQAAIAQLYASLHFPATRVFDAKVSKVVHWNDEEGRTQEEVVTALRSAAAAKASA